jgi:5-methylcytosine-specific restriction endonuclease McrA
MGDMTDRAEPMHNRTRNDETDFRCPWCAKISDYDSDDIRDDYDTGIEHTCPECQRVSVLDEIATMPREFTWMAKR